MLLEILFNSPQMFLVIVLAIIYALTIHEFSHAATANLLGDTTAKQDGRLNLNPLSHLEFWGTAMLLVAGFGWGRPVPVNPYNLKWRRFGEAAVALAGPLSNLLSVVFFVLLINLLRAWLDPDNMLTIFLFQLLLVNLILGIFNLIPIPPLDGSKMLMSQLPYNLAKEYQKLEKYGFLILLFLVFVFPFCIYAPSSFFAKYTTSSSGS